MKNKNNNGNKVQYMPIGMCFGISIGTAIGAATDNMALYMCVGLSIGMAIGTFIDAKNRKTSEEGSDSEDEETK